MTWELIPRSLEASDQNDFDLAISVFRAGIQIDNEEEDRSDRVGTYRGKYLYRVK